MRLTRVEAEEYKRCAASVAYTIKRYAYIKHISRGKMKWQSYPGASTDPCWQLRLLDRMQSGQNMVILKSRQVGASWTVAMFVAWLIHFRPDVEILLLSQKEKKAIKLLGKVKYVSRNFPPFIRREVNTDTKVSYSVVHRRRDRAIVSESSVDSLTTTGESGRGDTARLVFLDELAHLDNAEETWESIKPTTSHGGQIVAASSPKGNYGPFARLWMQADSGDSATFEAMKVHYTDCGFDEKWLAAASDGMTDSQIMQEYELAFLSSGSPAFDPNNIRACYFPDGLPEELAMLCGKSSKFSSGVDSAEIRVDRRTRRRDFHAITSLNEYGIQVAAETNKMPLEKWAGNTVDIGGQRIEVRGYVSEWHERFPGTMFIEENGAGLTVENRHQLPDDGTSEMYVKRTTTKSKPRLVNQLALALAGQQIIVTDKATYYQLMVFEDLGNGRYSAPPGHNDDLVVALMLAYDALIRMGGLEFNMPAVNMVGVAPVVSPLDKDFQPGVPTLPSMNDYTPFNTPTTIDPADWFGLDPRNMSIEQLRETIGN